MTKVVDQPPKDTVPATPYPSWRSRLVNWAFGFKPADTILKRRAVDLVGKLNFDSYVEPSGVYVDIGCGTGHNSVRMARVARVGRFVCVEPVAKPTKRVLRSIRKWGIDQIQFVRAVGNRLPLADHQAAGVSLFFVLHHVPYEIQLEVLGRLNASLNQAAYCLCGKTHPRTNRNMPPTRSGTAG